MNELPTLFRETLEPHFGPELSAEIVQALAEKPSISLRKNRRKPTSSDMNGQSVPWCPHGTMLTERPVFSLDPKFHGGAYYVQESSSMILHHVITSIGLHKTPILAADLCAAPGGKSTLMLDALHPESTLICNEVDGKRNSVLRENILKWGASNVIITKSEISRLRQAGALFDFIVLDAPCSGEGMFRKDPFAREQWSHNLVQQCAAIQHRLVHDAFHLLNPGGMLFYSTCTMNTKENEEQVMTALELGMEVAFPENFHDGMALQPANAEDGSLLGYYLLPGKSTGEGLFCALLRKTVDSETLTPSSKGQRDNLNFLHANDINPVIDFNPPENLTYLNHRNVISAYSGNVGLLETISEHAFISQTGIPFFERKGKLDLPHHGLAMASEIIAGPTVKVTLEEALTYLRKGDLHIPDTEKGWYRIVFEEINLGWVKVIGPRTNNYYPSSLRLRS